MTDPPRNTWDGAGPGVGADHPVRLDDHSLILLNELGLGPRPLRRLEAMVAAQLGSPRAQVLTVRVRTHPYDRPAITTAGRHLVGGTAVDDAGRIRGYTFFVKVVQAWIRSPLAAEVPEPLRTRAASLVPWRTEAEVYRSDLGSRLPRGLRLARSYRVADLDDDRMAIWLEDLQVRPVRWDVGRHRNAAASLGRLAGSRSVAPLAARVAVARTARNFAEHWLGITVIPDLTTDELWQRPLVAATFDPDLRRRILRAAGSLAALVDELETMPTTTAHGDACTDNLLLADHDDIVMIDFGFWGTAPVGFDLGQLLLGEMQLGRRRADTFAELERACVPAYVAGLRDEGCAIAESQVRRANAIAMTIFHAVPAIPHEHRNAPDGPELRALFTNRATMARSILDLLDATEATRSRASTPTNREERPCPPLSAGQTGS